MKIYGDFIYFNEETGRDEFDPYVYSVFFANKIQERLLIPEEEGGGTVTLGLSLEAFADKLESDLESFYKRFYGEIVADEELSILQEEIEEKVGIRIEFINFFTLCSFVNALIREHLFVLLKPLPNDVIGEIKEPKEIIITDADGTKVSITRKRLVNAVVKVIKSTNSKEYEIEKIVRIDEITNNVVMQSKFVSLIAIFLQKYFPDARRRKNCCRVSEPEQRLILRMLMHFNLSPEGITLTTSRFRQLIGYFDTLEKNEADMSLMGFHKITFVKYEDWSRNARDWTKTSFILHPLEEGDKISLENASELIKNLK